MQNYIPDIDKPFIPAEHSLEYPTYEKDWHYSNRLVIRRNSRPGMTLPAHYWCYVTNDKGKTYTYICDGADFASLKVIANPVWDPPVAVKKHSRFDTLQQEFLQHIEDVLSSNLKKNIPWQKFHASLVYHNGSKEVAFYPSVGMLMGHHMAWNLGGDHGALHSCEYCTYLRSREHDEIRKEWDCNPLVRLPI